MTKYAETDSVLTDTQLCEHTRAMEVYVLNARIAWCADYISVIKSDPSMLEGGRTVQESWSSFFHPRTSLDRNQGNLLSFTLKN